MCVDRLTDICCLETGIEQVTGHILWCGVCVCVCAEKAQTILRAVEG